MAVNLNLLDAKVLIVDDQEANIRLLERMLRASGYENLHTTTDPRTVSGLHSEHDFDLILLDINMPHMNGFQVIEQLSAQAPGDYLPILVLTAQTDNDTRLKALELGARDFLTKPFDRMEVLTRIRNMVEVRMLHNQILDHNRNLELVVRARTEELEDTRMEIIRRLGRAAEYRDNETGFHIIRMSKYSEVIGRAFGMSDADADNLLNASPMHDIGKIGIPDQILLKPGQLTADEWEIMKTHAAIGAEILSGHDSPLMETARIIALTHHERWDGSGYPQGLAGEDIPLEGRIVALSDVFDALTTERPYKKAWEVNEALAYIEENKGAHFDPQLVTVFMDMLPQILYIRAEYEEPETSAPGLYPARA